MTITDPSAAALRADYLHRLEAGLAQLPPAMAVDLRAELTEHLDQLAASGPGDPTTAMRSAIGRLGDPQQFLGELIADEAVRGAVRSRAPGPLLYRLLQRAVIGGRRRLAAAALLAAFVAALVVMLIGLLSPFFPLNVGLLDYADGRTTFGISGEAAAHERLGLWRVPIGVLGGLALWQLTRFVTGRLWATR